MKTSPLKKKETTKLGVFPNPAMSKKDLEKSQPQTRPFSQKRIRKNQRIQRTHWQPNHKHLSYTYGFPTTRRLHSGLIKSEGLMCTADPEKLWKQHESVPKKLDTCVTCFTIQEFHIYYQYMSSVCLYVTSCAAALQMISFDWHHKKEIHSIYIYISWIIHTILPKVQTEQVYSGYLRFFKQSFQFGLFWGSWAHDMWRQNPDIWSPLLGTT